jgi:hypothetical protein
VVALPHERTLLRRGDWVGPRDCLDILEKRKIALPSRYSNPGSPGLYSRHNTITNYAITTAVLRHNTITHYAINVPVPSARHNTITNYAITAAVLSTRHNTITNYATVHNGLRLTHILSRKISVLNISLCSRNTNFNIIPIYDRAS